MGLAKIRTSGALRAWSVLALATATATAVLAWPCACPDRPAEHARAHAAEPSSMHGPMGHGPPMAFEVGSPERPLVTRGPRGPLWSTSRPSTPGTTKHGTYGEQTVGASLERLSEGVSGASNEPIASRAAVVTTRQATTQLSARCQRLIKVSRKGLSERDRRRRLACIRQRRAIVGASIAANAPGVAAPTTPIQGPTPTAAPPPTPEATTPAPTTPPPTTPTKKYAAAGVRATDGDDPFQLTRGSATADIVNFELDNTDRQVHNLFIAAADAAGAVTGTPVEVIGLIEGGTRASADVELAPGRYKLICTVAGHGPMAVNFTVYAPPT